MIIYRTKRFEEQMDEYGKRPVVESREGKIREARTQAEASRVTRPHSGFLVTKSSNFRLIASVVRVRDRSVFVWHEILTRGGHEYRNFSNYSTGILSRLDMRELSKHVDESILDEIESSRPPRLPDDYLPWLQPIHAISAIGDNNEFIVYETKSWVRDMEGRIADRWPIYELVRSIVDHLQDSDIDASELVHDRSANQFKVFAQKTENKKIFLLGIVEKYETTRNIKPVPIGDAIRHARRSYPSWLLADEQLWFAIQQKETHNLALSPEEEELLEKGAGLTPEGVVLPMFINGQAGSGKSTMLAYVFAGLIEMWRQEGAGGIPLFVTYNSHLLEKTKDTTRKILRARVSLRDDGQDEQLKESFLSWHDYLLTKVPPESRERFEKWNRIDYNDFILGWEQRGGKLPPLQVQNRNEYSPAMVWYVIRTLIKGSDIDGDLQPDDYSVELTNDERTVSEDDYRRIFDRYYSSWYKPALRDSGLWDDQDLTFEALEAVEDSSEPTEIAALVVDEAQDFTRRELRLITRTTAFSHYEIPSIGGVRPPIILAGDPLQTLSPTGFRWSAVKAGIYEELRGLFGADARDPYFTELLKNYRSVEPIVKLANSIQLWRSYLFGLSEIRPQEAWSPEEDVASPERFSLDQIDEDEFIRFAADTVLIVPCEEGGEIDYVRADSILSRMFPEASEMNPPATVFSAASIKGLEYEKVLLYKFGERASSIDWSPRDDEQRDLLAEYFFNKLYVAATRATHYLYVVDTADGDDALWGHFSGDSISLLLKSAGKRQRLEFTESHVSGIEYGASDLSGVQEQNPRQNAEKTKAYALETGSVRKMRQAASYFRRAGDRREAAVCEGLALKFEGALFQAGKKFREARNQEEAWQCFWDCQAWQELDEFDAGTQIASSIDRAAVSFMSSTNPTDGQVIQLSREIAARPGHHFEGRTWSLIAERLRDQISLLKRPLSDAASDALPRSLEVLWEAGHLSVAIVAVDLFIENGSLARARRILDLMNPGLPEVALRLFKIEGAPEGLGHLGRANLNERIRQEWIESGRPYDPDWLRHVLPALDGSDFVADRLSVLVELGDLPTAIGILLAQTSINNDLADLGRRIVQVLADQGQAGEAIEFVNEVCDLPGSDRKNVWYQYVCLSIASALERRNWEVTEREAGELRELSQTLYSVLQGGRGNLDRVSPELVPAIGAVLEMAGRFGWASKVYSVCADSRDTALRDYCRRRSLLMATEQLKDPKLRGADRAKIQQEQQDNSRRWSLGIDQRGMARKVTIEAIQIVVEDPRPNGMIGPVQWSTPDGQNLMVNFVGDGFFEAARISLVGGVHQGNPSVSISSNSEFVSLAVGELEVAIGLGQEVRIQIKERESLLGSALVYRRSAKNAVRPAPTKRTRAAGDGTTRASSQRAGTARRISIYDLANELSIPVKEVLTLARSIGLPVRRGDAKVDVVDADLIRRLHRRRSGAG